MFSPKHVHIFYQFIFCKIFSKAGIRRDAPSKHKFARPECRSLRQQLQNRQTHFLQFFSVKEIFPPQESDGSVNFRIHNNIFIYKRHFLAVIFQKLFQ